MSNNTLDEMFNQFKTVAEFKAYSESQYKTIIELSKKINKLQEENESLKKMLEQKTTLLAKTEDGTLETLEGLSDEESICKLELNKLRNLSLGRELTLEETRKVEIYSKVLNTAQERRKKAAPNENISKLDDAQLISLMDVKEESKKH